MVSTQPFNYALYLSHRLAICDVSSSIIYVPRSRLVFYDASWDGTGRIPRFYRLNHSNRPNCAPVILDPSVPPREQEIAWVLLRDVAAMDELTFKYEDAPADWN